MTTFSKSGHLFSEVYLAFVRSLPCCLCHRDAPSEAHHAPPKGRGVTRDDKSMPVCRECHQRCHGTKVSSSRPMWSGEKHQIEDVTERLPPVGERRQRELVEITMLKFWEHATDEQWAAFAEDRKRWIESRGGAPDRVPW